MHDRVLRVGIVGTVVAAIRCFTSALGVGLGVLGASSLVGWLDYGRVPALARGWLQCVRILAVLGVLSVGNVARAEILSADLQVNGMTCPFCAFGIEKKLLGVDGVAEVEVLLDEGRLHLQLRLGNTATTREFAAAVEKAGFELAGLTIEVRGTLHVDGAETWLEAHDALRFLLLERDGERRLSPGTRERIPVAADGRVAASGRVLRAQDELRLVLDP